MDCLSIAEEIAERLRQEPYRLFTNDCLTKSIRFVRECKRRGCEAKLVLCFLGLTRIRLPVIGYVPFICSPLILLVHLWGEVQGRRFETSRPLGHEGFMGIVPSQIKPLLEIKFKIYKM
jgi:hypothetical protein